ncbi:MAG: ABC transporter substrate-binding protein, partial [Clostridiales bacterium]|nr:ABC transporter substrate-binding protein [Clostridiales bacterium]
MDPFAYNDGADQITYQIYMDSLIYSNHDGSPYSPMLAKSWDIDPDGMYWIFYLRDDVDFHNGDHFDADDVVASIEYLLTLKDTSALYLTYNPTIESVEKIDQYTVKVNFNVPSPLAGNGFRCMYMSPASAFEELGSEEMFRDYHSYGTGPWILTEFIDGQYAYFTKNENYYNKEYNSYFDDFYLLHLNEPSSIVAGMLAGDIDAHAQQSGFDPNLLEMYAGSEDRIQIITQPTNSNSIITFQQGPGKPGKDFLLRKAFSMSFDRPLMWATIADGQGIPATGYWAPNMPGHNPQISPNYVYDPEAAKAALDESAYSGQVLDFMGTGTGNAMNMALAMVDFASKIGINCEYSVVDTMTYNSKRADYNYDIYISGTIMPDKAPGRTLASLLSDNSRTQNDDEILFDLIRKWLSELDDVKRTDYAFQIGNRITEVLSPQIAYGHSNANWAVSYGISGIDLYEDGMVNFTWVDW